MIIFIIKWVFIEWINLLCYLILFLIKYNNFKSMASGGGKPWQAVAIKIGMLDSRSNSLGLSSGQSTALCSWARDFTRTVLLFTQVYKWVPSTVNSCLTLADTLLLRTFAITDKFQIPGGKGLTGNESRYCRLSLLRTPNNVPRVSATTRVDCNCWGYLTD